MSLHTEQFASPLPPSAWARVAAWFAVVVLLFGSVAEAGHVHRLSSRPGAAIGHAATALTADSDAGTNCPLCLLDGSAVPVHALRRATVMHSAGSVAQPYSSRAVPLCVPFALSHRPPPAA